MLKLTIKNAYTYISGIPVGQIPHCIINSLQYVQTTYSENSKTKKTSKTKITNSLLDKEHMRFPSGTYPKVVRALKRQGIDYELIDDTVYPTENPAPTALHPRPYQEAAIESIIGGQNEYAIIGRGILDIATGGGKTIVAACIAAQYNRPTIFFVHTRDLLMQTKATFEEVFGPEQVGVAGGGGVETYMDSDGNFKRFIVAMVQSFAIHGKKKGFSVRPEYEQLLLSREVMFCDECHHQKSDTWFWVAQACPAAFRIGLSATPWSADGNDILLEAATGPVVYEISSKELVNLGWLSRPDIRLYLVETKLDDRFYDKKLCNSKKIWPRIYKVAIVLNPHRNAIIVARARRALQENKSVLIIINHTIHGAILAELLGRFLPPNAPVDHPERPVFMNSQYTADERGAALRLFKANKIRLLIGTTLYDEGVDLPTMNVCIMGAGGMSDRRTIQRLGRALRRGDRCIYLTVKENCSLLGSDSCPMRCIELQRDLSKYDESEVNKHTEYSVHEYLGNIKRFTPNEWEIVGERIIEDVNSREILQCYNACESNNLLNGKSGIPQVDELYAEISALYSDVGYTLQQGNTGKEAHVLKGTWNMQDGKNIIKPPTEEQMKWHSESTAKALRLFWLCNRALGILDTVSITCTHKKVKDTVEYIDFMDACDRTLKKHSMERLRTYEDQGHTPMPGTLDDFYDFSVVEKTKNFYIDYDQMIEQYGELLLQETEDDKNIVSEEIAT